MRSVLSRKVGTVSTILTTTSFWWWILIALWHSITKRGSTYLSSCRVFVLRGESIFFLLELMEIRLYLGAWLCTYLFRSWYIFVGLFMLGGVTFIVLYVSCFICLLIYIYELFIDICLYCVLVEIKNLFCLLVFSTHAVMHFCLMFQEIYRLIQLSCCLHLQLMDSS